MTGNAYSGIENLDALERAHRYNRFLVDLILDARADAASALDFAGGTGAATALDYGAGTGTLAAAVREAGLSVECIELDPDLRARLHGAGFRVAEDLSAIADGTRGFIYSVNVLEHIADDEAVLGELYAKLRPGGKLLLYVPAFQVLYSSMDRKVGHHRRYRTRALADLARSVGFQVERAEYADSLGFFVTLLYKLVGSRQGDISDRAVAIYDRFVFPPSRLLDHVGFSRILGKNLIVLLRRPAP